MPDRIRAAAPPPPLHPLTASAQIIAEAQASRNNKIWQYESWQQEAWGFYDSLGEFEFGVGWLSAALSRVRLTAAELVPGGDEPELVCDGPAAELVEQLGGGIAGRAQIMKQFGLHLSVPGECWLVAERYDRRIPLAQADWTVKSTDEIRPLRGADGGYEIRVDDNGWRALAPESLPVRVWDPHPRWSWRATSAARSAIPIMRTVELLNRRIIATLVSRLAMNGLLLIPQEYTINAPAEYQDKPDPFVAMLIDIAGRNIREPGSATASIPIPLKFASEAIDKWRHLTFGDGVDRDLIDERERELNRLATTLNLPTEVLTGIGKINHWGQWQMEESGIKMHVSPVAETIVGALTVGYMHPLLKAGGHDMVGPNGGKIIVWYDPSELVARPDKSQQALSAHDRIVISDTALRRESGLDEADAPTDDEVRRQLLVKLVSAGNVQAYESLTGERLGVASHPTAGPETLAPDVPQPSGPGGDGASPPKPAVTPGARTPPDTRGQPPPTPGEEAMADLSRRVTAMMPERVPSAAGMRAPPASQVNGVRHSRDGPTGGKRLR